MQVPILKAQQVQATGLDAPYAQADVTALSQGGGVAEGLSSIGSVLSEHAIAAKKQADITAVNNRVAAGTAEADRLSEAYAQLDGQAKAGAADKTIAAYETALRDGRADLTPDQQTDYDVWATRSLEQFRHEVTLAGDAAAYQAGWDSLGIRTQANNVAAARKGSRGEVRATQTPSLDPNGNPIDTSRPKVANADGSFSTERTITIEEDGKYILIPTIVDGKPVKSDAEAIDLYHGGKNPSVGTYDSEAAAEEAAVARSKKIGEVRGTGTEAPYFFTGNTDALLQDSLDAIKAFADAHPGHLYVHGMAVDHDTFIRLSSEIARSDHHQAVINGMLAPPLGEPIDDRAVAAYFKVKRGEIDPEAAKVLEARIGPITEAADSQRIASKAFSSHAGDAGTWSERQAAMEKEAKGNAGALKIIDSSVDGARTRETQNYSDQTNAILEGIDKGDTATTATQRAAHLPVAYKEAVAKALYNRDNHVVIEKQNNEYQKWATMATGVDPATGKPDPKMRDAFIAQDFTTEFGQMTEPDRNELMGFQKELKAGGGEKTTSLVSDDEIAQHVINTIAPNDKGSVREEKLYRTKRQLDALFEAERGDGPPLKPAQKQKIADEILGQSVFDKWGFGTGNITIYEAMTTDASKLDVGDIPDPIRESITSQLKAGGIADPSDEDVIRAYQKQLGVGLLNVIY